MENKFVDFTNLSIIYIKNSYLKPFVLSVTHQSLKNQSNSKEIKLTAQESNFVCVCHNFI